MKSYLITTGSLFSLITVLHVWKVIAEWPHSPVSPLFVLGMTALIALPGVFAWWAWRLLQNLRDGKKNPAQDSGDSAV